MQDESIPRRPLSGAQKRTLRVAAGLPRYTEAEAAARRLSNRRRDHGRWESYGPRLAAIKLERGCADCGFNAHPAALHFDHLPGTIKRRGLSRMASLTWTTVLDEIAKCEVVCANCHAIRTATRRQNAP